MDMEIYIVMKVEYTAICIIQEIIVAKILLKIWSLQHIEKQEQILKKLFKIHIKVLEVMI